MKSALWHQSAFPVRLMLMYMCVCICLFIYPAAWLHQPSATNTSFPLCRNSPGEELLGSWKAITESIHSQVQRDPITSQSQHCPAEVTVLPGLAPTDETCRWKNTTSVLVPSQEQRNSYPAGGFCFWPKHRLKTGFSLPKSWAFQALTGPQTCLSISERTDPLLAPAAAVGFEETIAERPNQEFCHPHWQYFKPSVIQTFKGQNVSHLICRDWTLFHGLSWYSHL